MSPRCQSGTAAAAAAAAAAHRGLQPAKNGFENKTIFIFILIFYFKLSINSEEKHSCGCTVTVLDKPESKGMTEQILRLAGEATITGGLRLREDRKC